MGGAQILELIEQAKKSGLDKFLTQNPVAQDADKGADRGIGSAGKGKGSAGKGKGSAGKGKGSAGKGKGSDE